MSPADAPPLKLGGVYEKKAPRGRKKVVRLVYVSEVTGSIFLFEVDRLWNRNTKLPEKRPLSEALQLTACDDTFRLPVMLLLPQKVEQQYPELAKRRDDIHSVIEPILNAGGGEDIYNPQKRPGLIAARANELHVSTQTIRRYLSGYWNYGADINACIPRDSDRGRRHGVFFEARNKRGKPNAATRLWKSRRYEGRNVRKKDLQRIETALRVVWIGRDGTLVEARRYFEDELCVRIRRDESGNQVTQPLSKRSVISDHEFYKWAHRLIKELDLRKEKEGETDARKSAPNPGNDDDIAPRVADVYDIDATPFNFELIADFRTTEGKAINLGKPTVLLVFDRRSKKIVGWYVYIGDENWLEGYRLALFSALTDKTAELERLEITPVADYRPWPRNPKCRAVYVDLGPGASKEAEEALSRVHVDRYLPPPASPYWKPTVEGGFGNFQNKTSSFPGGYRRTRRTRDRKRMRGAKLAAQMTLFEFEQLLVEMIIDYNSNADMSHQLDRAMKQAGAKWTPDGIYESGMKRRGGIELREADEREIFENLLPHATRTVTRRGVKVMGAHYWSKPLSRECGQLVDIVYHPKRPESIRWLCPDGSRQIVPRNRRGNRQWGSMAKEEIDLWCTYKTATDIKERTDGARHSPYITNRQRDFIAGAEGVRVRSRASPDIKGTRRVQRELSSSSNARDQLEPGFDRTASAEPAGMAGSVPGGSDYREVDTSEFWKKADGVDKSKPGK